MQQIVLQSEMGVSRLMDVLVDAREVLRNDALLLLIQLTKGHANLQKIVAFENAFDKLCDIMETVSIFLRTYHLIHITEERKFLSKPYLWLWFLFLT